MNLANNTVRQSTGNRSLIIVAEKKSLIWWLFRVEYSRIDFFIFYKTVIYAKGMLMIKNIEISNFKIIESLKLSSLKRVNVIAGKNGKGKTSILDSIFITNDIASPDCLIKPIAFRGGSPDLTNNELWLSYFRDFDRKNEISIKMELENGMKQETRVSIENIKSDTSNIGTVSSNVIERNQISPRSSYRGDVLKIRKYDRSQPESLSMKMEVTQQISGNQLTSNLVKHGSGIDATATTFITTSSTINNTNTISVLGNLIKNKDTKSIIESMKEINDKILNIELGVLNQVPEILFDTGGDKLVGLSSMGEGVGELLTILVVSYSTKNGIILIDEIENGIHYSLMPSILKTLVSQSHRNNNQIFVTTHSSDVVNSIAKLFSSGSVSESDISFTRIGYSEKKKKSLVNSFTLSEVQISSEGKWEIR